MKIRIVLFHQRMARFQIGKITAGEVFQAKGQSFSVEKLIGDPQLAQPFQKVSLQRFIFLHVIITVFICHFQAY